MKKNLDRFSGCLVGLACGGDAVGTAVEFKQRGSFAPVQDMTGGGPFSLNAGEWTDDTSMALCLAASLTEKNAFDPRDQMERYCLWMNDGYMASNGTCFDIGITVQKALRRFEETGEVYSGSTHPRSAGNGCLMRLAPVPMFFFADVSKLRKRAIDSARTTHGAAECLEATELFALMLHRALAGEQKERILSGWEYIPGPFASAGVQAIARGAYLSKAEIDIRGSGYVVDSLEAALWCFATTTNFKDAVLRAANLGDDADTTAAICGQLAGAHYGYAGIPSEWRGYLTMHDEILRLAKGYMGMLERSHRMVMILPQGVMGQPSSSSAPDPDERRSNVYLLGGRFNRLWWWLGRSYLIQHPCRDSDAMPDRGM